MDIIVRLPHDSSRASQGQEMFSAHSTVKKTLTYDTECSNHHLFLSATGPKGLRRSKMKW